MTSEMRFGPTEVHENLAFIAVTVPQGGPNQVESQSVRFGLIRESGEWKVLSVGLLLLDIPALARQWEAGDVQSRERNIVNALRTIARALKASSILSPSMAKGTGFSRMATGIRIMLVVAASARPAPLTSDRLCTFIE